MTEQPTYDTLAINERINLLEQVKRDAGELKQIVSGVRGNNGRQFSGACPFCKTGDDRFCVWPDKNPQRFYCRRCERSGDGIAYVMERDGLTFRQVCQECSDGKGSRNGKVGHTPSKPPKRAAITKPSSAEWQNTALLLVADCEAALWSEQGQRALDWLRNERGLSDETIRAWRLGYCPSSGNRRGVYCDRGILIPWFDATGRLWKVNVRRPTGKPKYRAVKGSVNNGALFGVDRLTSKADLFITEGEFDAILLGQAISDRADVVTLGSDSGRLVDNWLAALLPVKRFFVCTDADDAGEKAARHWLDVVGERGRRIYPPAGEKDVSDAARTGADLRRWALGLMGNLEKRLDVLDAAMTASDARLSALELERELEALLAEMDRADDLKRRGDLSDDDHAQRVDELQARFAVQLDAHQKALDEQECQP